MSLQQDLAEEIYNEWFHYTDQYYDKLFEILVENFEYNGFFTSKRNGKYYIVKSYKYRPNIDGIIPNNLSSEEYLMIDEWLVDRITEFSRVLDNELENKFSVELVILGRSGGYWGFEFKPKDLTVKKFEELDDETKQIFYNLARKAIESFIERKDDEEEIEDIDNKINAMNIEYSLMNKDERELLIEDIIVDNADFLENAVYNIVENNGYRFINTEEIKKICDYIDGRIDEEEFKIRCELGDLAKQLTHKKLF